MNRRLRIGLLLIAVAGIAYLATFGCCRLLGWGRKPVSITAGLGLTPDQGRAVAALERDFLARKQESCGLLCEKRAQLIQQMKQKEPDPAVVDQLVAEISTQQMALEKATVAHLLALRKVLDPAQQEKLTARLSDQLRNACQATACGTTPGCFLKGEKTQP